MPPLELAGRISAVLRDIVAECGPEVLSNRDRMEGILKDILPPSATPVIRALNEAVDAGVAEMLREYVGQGMVYDTAAKLTSSAFAMKTLYSTEVRDWLVGELGAALRLRPEPEPRMPTVVVSPTGEPTLLAPPASTRLAQALPNEPRLERGRHRRPSDREPADTQGASLASSEVDQVARGAKTAAARRVEALPVEHDAPLPAAWPIAVARLADASLLLNKGNFGGAETAFRRCVAIAPHEIIAHEGLVEILIVQNKLDEAEIAGQDAVRQNPKSVEAHAMLARALVKLECYHEAVIHYEKSIRLFRGNDHSARILLELGTILIELKKYEKAEPIFREAVRLVPGNADAHAGFGEVLGNLKKYGEAAIAFRRAGRNEDALDAYRAAIKCDGSEISLRIEMGEFLVWLRRYDEAESAFRGAGYADKSNVIALISLGNLLAYRRRISQAMEVFRQAIARVPESGAAYAGLGHAFLLCGRYRKAISTLREALSLDPGLVVARAYLGLALMGQQRYSDAVAVCREAVSMGSGVIEPQLVLGRALLSLGHYDQAESAFRHAINLNADCADAHLGLGDTCLRRRCYRDAERAFCSAADAYRYRIELEPVSADAHLGLGDALMGLGIFNESETSFLKAIDLDSNYADAYRGLYLIHCRQGNYGDALRVALGALIAHSRSIFQISATTQ